mgnify:CR=1 FL=1
MSDDGHIIFNSRRGSLILFDDDEYNRFLNNELTIDETNKLRDVGILVEKQENELQEIINLRYKYRENTKGIRFKIFTTTSCNARCPYCFEQSLPAKNMSLETATKVAEFIIDQSKDYETVELSWFGGEPLLNVEVINHICSILNNSEELQGKNISSHMLSNGSLFSKEIVEYALNNWHMRYVQITMDGTEKNHNSIKSIKGMNAFNQTINNIKMLLRSGIKVNVRINFNKKTIDDACKLIHYLHEEIGLGISVYGASLFYNDPLITIEDENTGPYYERIIDALFMNGYIKNVKSLALMPKVSGCSASNPHYFTIQTDGAIFRCPEVTSFKDEMIGSVYTYCDTNKFIPEVPDECIDCKLLPVCQGGCVNSLRKLINNTKCHRYRYSIDRAIIAISKAYLRRF